MTTITSDTKTRLDRIEAAINSLAFLESRLASIPAGVHLELDEIRAEQAGKKNMHPRLEQRPYAAAEQRGAGAARSTGRGVGR